MTERSLAELEADWKDLAGGARTGYAALGRLVRSPGRAVAFSITPGKAYIAASASDYILQPTTITWNFALEGSTFEITIVPLQPSQAVNDVVLKATVNGQTVASAHLTIADVEMGPNVRAADTPSGMNDRIPPRVKTPFPITITPDLGNSGQTITLELQSIDSKFLDGSLIFAGGGSNNGLFDLVMTKTTTVQLVGTIQTEPGYSGRLNLATKVRGLLFSLTKGFSISAIPVSVTAGNPTPRQGWVQQSGGLQYNYYWGATYPMTIGSDSGELQDLDKVQASEDLAPTAQTGIFANQPPGQPQFSPATAFDGSALDINAKFITIGFFAPPTNQQLNQGGLQAALTLRGLIARFPGVPPQGGSELILDQRFLFIDSRSGTTSPMIVKASGFHLVENAFEDAVGRFWVTVNRQSSANRGAQPGINTNGDTIRVQVGFP
jgi:hypothetical protein